MGNRSGFTLLELSLVMVIIGLIAGGIMIGRDIIRAAEIRKIHKQQEGYITAVNAFRMKYDCLPGDCANAEDLFGLDPDGACPASPGAPANNFACNGNGDGSLYSPAGNEPLEAWRQLADAGLIEGTFSGASVVSDPDATITIQFMGGYNCPQIVASTSCWIWLDMPHVKEGYFPSLNIPAIVEDGDYGTTVLLMTPAGVTITIADEFSPISSAYAMGAFLPAGSWVLTPKEALSYDQKFDDGSPVGGRVLAQAEQTYVKNCTTQDANGNYIYDVSQQGRNCAFFYRTNF